MNFIIEDIFVNPELTEIKNIINNTIKDFVKKYGTSCCRRLDYKYNFLFFDKKRIKQKKYYNQTWSEWNYSGIE